MAISMSPISVSAMSLNISSAEHVNKMPFSGVLARLGAVSGVAHASAKVRPVVLTEAAARAALSSLLGMAVRDERRRPIGIITAADIVQSELRVEGFIYASDFPDIANFVRTRQDRLGFQFVTTSIAASSEQRRTVSAAAAYVLDRAGIAAPTGSEKHTGRQVELALAGIDDPVRRISMRRTLEREGLA